jgi:hypothetical protein
MLADAFGQQSLIKKIWVILRMFRHAKICTLLEEEIASLDRICKVGPILEEEIALLDRI